MGPSGWMLCAAVTLIPLWGALCSPSCPSSCLCDGEWLINCSSVGPFLSPLLIQISVTTLDLSRNSLPSLPLHPHQSPLLHLTHLYLGQNLLTDLSVCEAPPTGEGQCETWTPNLELLSAERNQLQHIPEGLCGATALHTLHLSYNRISALRVGDLQGCAHLRDLHLQHNLISTLESLVFRELLELRTLDLSYNTLSTFPVPAYLSLSSLRVQVELGGNPWRCDCSLQALRSWMGVAHDALPWQLQCAEPPDLAGRDLLLLQDTDLTCDTPTEEAGSHQEVTAHLGTEILLPCRLPDQDFSRALWWTPDGSVRQASVGHGGGLRIQHISEQDQGLYVCISGPNQEPTSMFTVRVRAGAREGPKPGLRSGDRTHDELALAVCLSVFLTFIAAFAIGALTRPYLDTLWGKVQAWRRQVSTATPFENAGFAEEEEVGPEAERAGLGDANKPYYITIIPETDGSQSPPNGMETDTAAKEEGCSGATYENDLRERRPAPQPSPRQSQGEEPCHQGRGADQSVSSSSEEEPSHPSRTIEFEPIPDPKDLGIEELSTTESEESNQDLGLESDQDFPMDSFPDRDSKRDLGLKLEQKPDDDLGSMLNQYRVAPCDPFSISREELETDWLKNTRSLGENPFPAPTWTDSPCEPHPNAVQTPPQDGIQPDLDPELWNDSGESFEFTDSLIEESTRGGSSLAQQLQEGPWSQFHQLMASQQVPNDPAELQGQPQEGEGPPMRLSVRATPSSSSSSEESDQPTEHTQSPEITAVCPENATIYPDSTILNPLNAAIRFDDTAVNPENTVLHQEDNTIHPDNAALHPESTAIHPKNTAFYPEIAAIYTQNQPLHPKHLEIHSENTAIHWGDPRYEEPKGSILLTDMTHPQLTGSGRADAPWVISTEDQADVEMGSYFGIETDLTWLKTVAHPLLSCDSEGHGHSTIVSGLTAEPWSSQKSAQGPVGRHISYKDTDQDPTLGAAPGPVKPRRSFKQQINPLSTLQQEETPTPLHLIHQDDMPTPSRPVHQEDMPTPSRPVHQEDMPTPSRPVHQEDMPTPSRPVHQEDMHTPSRPVHQEDMHTPSRPVHQEDMPTPSRPVHQEDMPTPLRPVHQEDMPTPLRPVHQEDMPTPLRPIHQEDMPTPLRPVHQEDMHTPLCPIHQEDMPTPLHPVHQEDMHTPSRPIHQEEMPTPLRPIHQEDMPTPLCPIHQEDMPTPLHPVHQKDMHTPSHPVHQEDMPTSPQPIQKEDMSTTLQPFQEDTPSALQLLQQDATSTPFQPIQREVMLTLLQPIQPEDIPIALQPTQQEDTPTTLQPFQQEDTPTALRSIQQDEMSTPVFPSNTLDPPIQFDTQRKEPAPFVAPLTTPTQGSQRQDWRRGGQFFQRRRVIDTFSMNPKAPSHLGSAQLTFSQVTVETVTTATDESNRSQWFRLGEGGEEQTSAATAEEGHVTSDPMSCFLFGTSNDKGSEA